MTYKTPIGLLLALLGLQTDFAPPASATIIRYDFLGGTTTTVVGGTPLVTALFEDVAPNQVNLTVTAPGLTGSSYLSALWFNLTPDIGPAGLIFNPILSNGGVQGVVTTGTDSFKTGGGGKFDINIKFQTPAFGGGDSIVYSITGLNGFSADSFAVQDTLAAGVAQTYAAASIQLVGTMVILNSTPTSPVPDTGSTAWLMALCLLPLALFRKSALLHAPVPARINRP